MESKYHPKTDCFAYQSGGCVALDDLYCAKECKCNFYKTDEQHSEDRRKAHQRILNLASIKK